MTDVSAVAGGAPSVRIRPGNASPLRTNGDYVLYWMTAFRRTSYNFALDRAAAWAKELRRPLLVFEGLRAGYRWASARFHRFVLDGMADNQRSIEQAAGGVAYYPYVEPEPAAGRGLLKSLASRACIVIADDSPAFFLPRMIASAASRLEVRIEQVDSCGLLPLRSTRRVFTTAHSFRAFLQKELPTHLVHAPQKAPLEGLVSRQFAVPEEASRRWPLADARLLAGNADALAGLPIDHSVSIVPGSPGGTVEARRRLGEFLSNRLDRYCESANQPDDDVRSNLSPYLHFGHVSTHELFERLASREQWSISNLSGPMGGAREGWWGVSPAAEAWLDQLVTWRELGFNMAAHDEAYDRFESLPAWSRETLARHARDVRPHCYELEDFAPAATHDPLWNAAQNQLLREGAIHNYLRMLWGKKILEWSPSPQQALEVLVELNNRYALDGRDPNSYSGIFWVLGRYDRPWGPERPIFGTVRYMSSENTARKLRVREYMRRYNTK